MILFLRHESLSNVVEMGLYVKHLRWYLLSDRVTLQEHPMCGMELIKLVIVYETSSLTITNELDRVLIVNK